MADTGRWLAQLQELSGEYDATAIAIPPGTPEALAALEQANE